MENHVSERKRLKKAAAKRLGLSLDALGWVDGTLVFLASNTSVDGVPTVMKPVEPPEPKPAYSRHIISVRMV